MTQNSTSARRDGVNDLITDLLLARGFIRYVARMRDKNGEQRCDVIWSRSYAELENRLLDRGFTNVYIDFEGQRSFYAEKSVGQAFIGPKTKTAMQYCLTSGDWVFYPDAEALVEEKTEEPEKKGRKSA